ncbi:MAG: type I glyceraldehyde-3-phosphate dehydrogenase [Magnetococcales bacterium]|nr:type I glyceraldehyde-3-phosphate dehydrogenase [Magnetococcales bacterium]MBF0116077.1 type I glyceraldehyde-3-phosphate dehydrogenase [Magnetococcales bacterium]
MTVRVGINGFGRIGRQLLRTAWQWATGWHVVHINDLSGDAACAAHLLQYDSTHGRWSQMVEGSAHALHIGGEKIGFTGVATPQEVDWASYGVDVVVECSGQFKSVQALQPTLQKGVRLMVVSSPILDDAVLNVVMGVNDGLLDVTRQRIVTVASCTTNSLAPVLQVILRGIGIVRGSMTTVHCANNAQSVVDGYRSDWRRGRAASVSMIPTSTSAARTIGWIIPELAGKMDGMAIRVPLLHASLTDMALEVPRNTTVEEINGLLLAAAEGALQGILGYSTEPLVSIDYCNDRRSAVIDALSTRVIDGRHVKILAWYDNETGYCSRLVELLNRVVEQFGRG